MIGDILNAFKAAIEVQLQQTGGKPVKVDYVNLENAATPLEADAVNLLLFTSSEKRDILGNETFGIPTNDNHAIQQKPALKLSLNVLLIFNLKQYVNALDCYSQVLGSFYNHNILDIYFNGSKKKVDVLLSGFDDRNEIEIRNSFNIPGTPLLRYDLNYTLIQGGMKRLPIVQKTGLKSNVPSKESFIPEVILNLICTPIEDCLLLIEQSSNYFIHLKLE